MSVELQVDLRDSSNQLLVSYLSNMLTLKSGVNTIRKDQTQITNSDYKNHDLQRMVVATGFLPEGNYNLCVTVRYVQNNEIQGTSCRMLRTQAAVLNNRSKNENQIVKNIDTYGNISVEALASKQAAFNQTLPSNTKDFIEQVKKIGMAIGGQTAELAPADGKIYALRDVTGTVESIPLIAASVMSKKLAAGANLIILDVKCGKGAFMETEEKAKELAATMASVGRLLKRPVLAVVTDMEQPLGFAVGHTVEVIEAIETLKGNGPDDLNELCMELGALALVEAGKASDKEQAQAILKELISSGKALNAFAKLIEAQGGDSRVLTDYSLMPHAKHQKAYLVPGQAGAPKWLEHIDGRKVAEAAKVMGAGRVKKGDPVDLGVGIILQAKCGDALKAGDAAAIIHYDTDSQYEAAAAKLAEAFTFVDKAVAKSKLIKASIA